MSRNRYPGVCYRCGLRVETDEGEFEYLKFPGQRWPQLRGTASVPLVQHNACALRYFGTDTHYLHKPDLSKV